MYVVVKGGEIVICNVYCLFDDCCCGDCLVLVLCFDQIVEQLGFVVDCVMVEGLFYD